MNDMNNFGPPLSNRLSQGPGFSDLNAERKDLKARIASLDTCVSQLELDNKLIKIENDHLNKLLQEKDSHIETLKQQDSSKFKDLQDRILELNDQLKFRDSEIYRLSWAHQDSDFLINRLRRTIDETNQQSLKYVSIIANLETDISNLCSRSDSTCMESEEEKEMPTISAIAEKSRETIIVRRKEASNGTNNNVMTNPISANKKSSKRPRTRNRS